MRNRFTLGVALWVAVGLATSCTGQYPKGTFLNGDKDALQSFANYAPLRPVEGMKEDTLNQFNEDTVIYRFTWLRTFDHPMVFKLTVVDGVGEFNWKECDGASGYEIGNMIVDDHRFLREEEYARFVQLFDAMDFYHLQRGSEHGLDGATWIMEACSDHYWAVVRWSPDNGAFRDCCLYLLLLSGLKVNDIY